MDDSDDAGTEGDSAYVVAEHPVDRPDDWEGDIPLVPGINTGSRASYLFIAIGISVYTGFCTIPIINYKVFCFLHGNLTSLSIF